MESAAIEGPPPLTVSRCTRDGFSAYPADDLGCQMCGATPPELEILEAEGRGTVRAVVTVHRHRGWPDTPFQIAAIQLDAGPVVRTLLLEGGVGDAVTGQHVVDADGTAHYAFAPAVIS